MMLIICLLCSLCVLVSPAPITPTTPSQTYPIYQQNDYGIPTSNPTNYFNPYLLQNTAGNVPPFDLTQILLSKILSRPSLQAILDPSYGLNEVATPSVVNNYIILPMECPNQNKTDINQDTSLSKVVNAKTDKKSNKRGPKNKSKRKPSNEQEQPKVERDKDTLKNYNIDLRTINPQTPSQITENKNNTINNGNERNSKRYSKKRKQRQNEIGEIKESTINNCTKSEFNLTTQEPRRRGKKTEKDANNNLMSGVEQSNNISPTKVANIGNSTKTTVKLSDSENKVPTNNKNRVANDFLKTFPNVPENMASNFMTGMNQFNNPQLTSFFGNYEQFYQSLVTGTLESNKRTKKKRKLKNNRRNRKRNQKNKGRNENNLTNSNKSPDIVGINPSKSANVGAAANVDMFRVTTEKPNLTDVRTQPDIVNLGSNPITEASISIETTPVVKMSATIDNEDQVDEVDVTEDVDDGELDTPSMYYGIIDDYYPLFNDNAAYANNKMLIKSLDSERLFYISDDTKNITNYDYTGSNINDREINKNTYDGIEVNTETNFKEVEAELQFRQPPLLELPDFITRKVERSEIKPNRCEDSIEMNDRVHVPDVIDKSSSYSNAKTSNSGGLKQSKSKLNNNVETVYARSKVVKYGQIEDLEEDANTKGSWESFQNDGTTYVVAKSLDPGEFW